MRSLIFIQFGCRTIVMENTNPQEDYQNQVSSDTSNDTPEVVSDEILTSPEVTADSEQSNKQETQVESNTSGNSRSPGKDRDL
ncbi:hypothetical protein Cylst_6621 (plasmid) [Cylindrospermum stagnale PCC 7417]|uniref:Uncharacterized protein n=2 Tax=Cylindrospermum stagnale TaxID=142864 RepID=K9X8J0_9NOST|nr:hypothetical protein Cylst_6621 [Cylindrospermum stagnale PCC 7417]